MSTKNTNCSVTITGVKDIEPTHIRYHQVGTQSRTMTQIKFKLGAKLNFVGVPNAFPWMLIEFYNEEKLEDGRPAFNLAGCATVSLLDNEYTLDLFDPSVRDAKNEFYRKVGSLEVTVNMCFQFSDFFLRLTESIPRLYAMAKEEREGGSKTWVNRYSKLVLDQNIDNFYLHRFTVKNKDQMPPAYWLVDLVRFLPPATDDLIAHMYQHATAIHFTTPKEVEGWLRGTPTAKQLHTCEAILGDMMTFAATATYYTGDHTADRTVVERFSAACYQRLEQGDCEDLALAIFMTFHSFLWNKSPQFAGLRRLMSAYECAMSVGAASYAKLDAEKTSSSFICHVWAMMIPKRLMATWTEKPARARESNTLWDKVHVLMAEGTNFCDYFGMEKTFYLPKAEAEAEVKKIEQMQVYYERVVDQVPDLANKTVIRFKPLDIAPQEPQDLSDFYCYILTLWILAEGTDPIAYNFVHNKKIGTGLHHVMRGNPEIRLLPHVTNVSMGPAARMSLLSFETPVVPLVPLGSAEEILFGKKNEDAYVEFRYQTKIPNLEQLLSKVEGFRGYSERIVQITEGSQVHILQVYF
jgi:hypothetical protein